MMSNRRLSNFICRATFFMLISDLNTLEAKTVVVLSEIASVTLALWIIEFCDTHSMTKSSLHSLSIFSWQCPCVKSSFPLILLHCRVARSGSSSSSLQDYRKIICRGAPWVDNWHDDFPQLLRESHRQDCLAVEDLIKSTFSERGPSAVLVYVGQRSE